MAQISTMVLQNWRQFDSIDIKFHPRLTIITGANGAGKTTILNMLSRLLGWSVGMLSVSREEECGLIRAVGDKELPFPAEKGAPIGTVGFTNGGTANLGVDQSGEMFTEYAELNHLKGVYIISHRQMVTYSPVEKIPTSVSAAEELLKLYIEKTKDVYQVKTKLFPEYMRPEDQPHFRFKEALISLAIFGEGNSIVSPNPSALDTFRDFEDILRAVLPADLGFIRFYIKMPEVFFISRSGVFPLEAVSGGIAALVDQAWQIYLASKVYEDFIVLIDEPENHLHPSMQRSVLGSLVTAFPRAQFVVSTHSPLVITSVENSAVYVLRRVGRQGYRTVRLDFEDRAASAEEVLYEVLGVESSTPVWAARKLEDIVRKYEDKIRDPASLEAMTEELRLLGLGGHITEVLSKLIERSGAKAN